MKRRWVRALRADDDGLQVEPSCDQATIAAAQAEIGASATAWAVQTAAVATQSALAAGQPGDPAAALFAPMRRACESCVLTIVCGLHADTPADRLDVPAGLLDSVRSAVHAGVPLDRLLRAMWNAHMTTMDALLPGIEASLDPRSAAAQARAANRLSFGYVNVFGDQMTEEYNAEREAWMGSVASARRETVARLIGHRQVDVAAAERLLGVRLTDHHLALVIWSDGASAEPMPDRPLLDLVTAAADAVGATGKLAVHGPPSSVWAWLSWRGAPDRSRLDRLARLAVPGQVRVAAGPVSAGQHGFRRSHAGALEALRLHALSGSWLCSYPDIAVSSLLTMNREHSLWYAAETLGPLAGESGRHERLRETLRVYLEEGRSRAGAGTRLRVSPGTVAYRVKQAEALLSRPLDGRETEVLVALEIVRGDAAGAATPPEV